MVCIAHLMLSHVHECEGLLYLQSSNRCSRSQPQELDVIYTFTHSEDSLACDHRCMRIEGFILFVAAQDVLNHSIWIHTVGDECKVLGTDSQLVWFSPVVVPDCASKSCHGKNDPATFDLAWTQQHKNDDTMKTVPIISNWLLWREDVDMGVGYW